MTLFLLSHNLKIWYNNLMTKTRAFFICFFVVIILGFISAKIGLKILSSVPFATDLYSDSASKVSGYFADEVMGEVIAIIPTLIVFGARLLFSFLMTIFGVLIIVSPAIATLAAPIIISKKYGPQFRPYGFYGVFASFVAAAFLIALFK